MGTILQKGKIGTESLGTDPRSHLKELSGYQPWAGWPQSWHTALALVKALGYQMDAS